VRATGVHVAGPTSGLCTRTNVDGRTCATRPIVACANEYG
jgi:hypothetical protein